MKLTRTSIAAFACSFITLAAGLAFPSQASATLDCDPAPIIYSHSPSGIEKYNISTGQFTTITNNPDQTFFDVGTTPNGSLYGVSNGGGNLFLINKTTGASTPVATVAVPAGTNFNMLAFDRYGKGWFVGASGTKLMSFDPNAITNGTITPTTVVSNLQTAGFPSGSSSGDVFFLNGEMYIAWASSDNAPRDGVRLIRLDMTDTGSAYTATGASGTAIDLGKIDGQYIWGMAVYDGVIYVANDGKISRLDSLPTTQDVNRSLTVTDIASGTIGTIYGMTAEGEANIDPCLDLAKFSCNTSPIIYTHSPSGIEKYNISTGQFTLMTASPSNTFFDMGVSPNGKLYAVDGGGGDLYQIDKSSGAATPIGTVAIPANTNFNMLAFDKYGKGWFVADNGTKLMSFDPGAVTNGTITPTTVVSDLQATGFPTGSSSGDVFFVNGNMYIAWASNAAAPRDGVRLIRLNMTDTGSAYTATGASGTSFDLGKIEASLVWGMTVHDGITYVANGNKISRLDSLPTTQDVNRTLAVSDIATGNIGNIFGMAAEGEWRADGCTNEQYFSCQPSPVIYSHSPNGIEKYNISTGQFTTITNNPQRTYFDVGTTPDGRLLGVVNGGGDLYEIRKSTGDGTLIGSVTVPGGTNFNMLAFDKYGKGWFVAENGTKLMSFDPRSITNGTITPTTVVSNLQTAGFPTGNSAGDVFFIAGDMYIAWASSAAAPRDGVRLIRLDMTDTGSTYTASGAAGSAVDLGKIGGNYIWGMAVFGGVVYVANGEKISRLNTLPTTADVNRVIEITDIATGSLGVIYGMTAEGEAAIDSCATVQTFVQKNLPSATTSTSSTTTVAPQTTSPSTSTPTVTPISKSVKRTGSLPTTGGMRPQLIILAMVFLGLGISLRIDKRATTQK